MRGSSRLVVALREPSPQESVESLLGEWASSIWTLPELLLSPGRQFQAYHFSLDVRTAQCGIESRVIPKNQFPARCLTSDEDRYQVRKLLDHYLGNLKLGELELLAVALKCFSRRSMGSTGEQYLPGDYSYALMGLLSQRPNIDPHDSAFLAFARYACPRNCRC